MARLICTMFGMFALSFASSLGGEAKSDKKNLEADKEFIRVEIKGVFHYDPPPDGVGGIQPNWGIVVQRGLTIVAKGITWRIAFDMDRKDLDSLIASLPLESLKGKTVIAIGTLDGSMSHTEVEVEGIRPILVLKSLKAVESK